MNRLQNHHKENTPLDEGRVAGSVEPIKVGLCYADTIQPNWNLSL